MLWIKSANLWLDCVSLWNALAMTLHLRETHLFRRISLDTEIKPPSVPNLVVLARLKKSREDGRRYFVLFVEQQGSRNYERIGVGMIQEGCELAPLKRYCII